MNLAKRILHWDRVSQAAGLLCLVPPAAAFAVLTLPYVDRKSVGELAFIVLVQPVFIAIIGAAQIVMLIFIRAASSRRLGLFFLATSAVMAAGQVMLIAGTDFSGSSTAPVAIPILSLYLAATASLGCVIIRWMAARLSRRPDE